MFRIRSITLATSAGHIMYNVKGNVSSIIRRASFTFKATLTSLTMLWQGWGVLGSSIWGLVCLNIAANLSNHITGSVFVPLSIGILSTISLHSELAWKQQSSLIAGVISSCGNLAKISDTPAMGKCNKKMRELKGGEGGGIYYVIRYNDERYNSRYLSVGQLPRRYWWQSYRETVLSARVQRSVTPCVTGKLYICLRVHPRQRSLNPFDLNMLRENLTLVLKQQSESELLFTLKLNHKSIRINETYLMIADAYLSIHIVHLVGECWYSARLYACFPASWG